MIIYALQSVYSVIAKLCHDLTNGMNLPFMILTAVLMVVIAVCIILLAFVKNLGVSKSLKLAAVNFWVSTVSAVIGIIFHGAATMLPEFMLTPIIISVLAFVFVSAKYADKEARGAK